MKPASLGWPAPTAAALAAISGFLYAVSFVVLKNQLLFSLFLMLGALFSIVVFVELQQRLSGDRPGPAMLALLLGILGAAGALAHGGFDLANSLHPPQAAPGIADLPSAVDPRGLAAFGLTGLAMLLWSATILETRRLGRGLGYLGILSGILLLLTYLARLIVLDASTPQVLAPALVEGFIVNPAWYLWLAAALAASPAQQDFRR